MVTSFYLIIKGYNLSWKLGFRPLSFMNLSKSMKALLCKCFLLRSLTALSLSNSPAIAHSKELAFGHFASICCFSKNSSYLIIFGLCSPSWFFFTMRGLSSFYTMTFCSASSEISLSPPASVLMYFLRELVSTRLYIFCIKTSSSCWHALLSCLCVLSMLHFTCVNFWTDHLETSIRVLIFSRAWASSLAMVRYSLPLN